MGYTSHLDSEEDNDECRPKRKRISKIYYSSSEESFVSKKQKQNKNKSKIRSPPIIRALDKCTSDREDVTLNSVANSSRERNFTENENFNSSVIPITSTNNNNNKYRINRQRISEIYFSSEESFVSKKQKQNKNKNKIRSSPIIRASDKYTSDREDVTLNFLAEISCIRNFTENENINSCIMSATSMNNNKNTEPLELLILKKLKKLDYIQNNIIVPDMQEILTFLRPQKLEVFQETNIPTLPIDNDTQLNEFEQYLSTTENYKNIILKFSRVGGHGAAGMTRKIMKNLITSKFAMNFNWRGRVPKKPFKELKSKDLLLDSVRKTIPSASTQEIESAIKDWLKQAKTRVMSHNSYN